MFDRTTDTLAFVTILAVCLAGAFKASWLAAVIGACTLSLISLRNAWQPQSVVRRRAVSDPIQLAASALSGVAVSVSAFGFGLLTAVVWG